MKIDVQDLLKSYPRQRPPLSPKHADLYAAEYAINRSGKGVLYRGVALLESWMHRQTAKSNGSTAILELGAGALNHVKFEKHFTHYDVVESLPELCKQSPLVSKIRHVYEGYGALTPLINREQYGRVISIAVLEHLDNLPLTLATSALLLKDDGVFQSAIPTEGGLAWALAWRMSTGIAYRLRTRLSYIPLMKHEHINSEREIYSLLKFLYEDIRISRFPIALKHLSLYTYFECRMVNKENCRQIIEGNGLFELFK
jgi:hypothetical protein